MAGKSYFDDGGVPKALLASIPPLRAAGKKACRVLAEMEAASVAKRAKFSKRIPAATRVVDVAGGSMVEVDLTAAPDALPIENDGKGHVRHPTFSPRPSVPNRVGWTSKHSHAAFFAPSEREAILKIDQVGRAVQQAQQDALDEGGV